MGLGAPACRQRVLVSLGAAVRLPAGPHHKAPTVSNEAQHCPGLTQGICSHTKRSPSSHQDATVSNEASKCQGLVQKIQHLFVPKYATSEHHVTRRELLRQGVTHASNLQIHSYALPAQCVQVAQ